MFVKYVKLGVRDYEDMAVHPFCPCGFSLTFQLDSVCGVYNGGATSMHFLTGHGAQIDQKPELIVGVELFQGHMLGFVFFFHEKVADLFPSVLAFYAFVVQHIR